MSDHPIQNLMKTAMENIKQMVEVNTIVGDPIHTPHGQVIIPVSRVGFGFAAGGSEFTGKLPSKELKEQDKDITASVSVTNKLPFGGGSGGGVSVAPIGFIVVGENNIRFLAAGEQNQIYHKLLDLVEEMWKNRKTKHKEQPIDL
ncbi:MAG: sporulation protein YtfJ [Bacillota bacterium]|jgi:sporulation protein YtfJ